MICPLCQLEVFSSLKVVGACRGFWHCANCDLIFVDPSTFPNLEQETRRYEEHHAGEGDPGHRKFLSPVLARLMDWYPQESHRASVRILDFGAGPRRVLLQMLEEVGFETTDYHDPLYFPKHEYRFEQYDVIVSTEVFEHFHNPAKEFDLLHSLLGSSGQLLVMTQLHRGPEHFANWWYHRDKTHVVFYSEKTLNWISGKWNFRLSWV